MGPVSIVHLLGDEGLRVLIAYIYADIWLLYHLVKETYSLGVAPAAVV